MMQIPIKNQNYFILGLKNKQKRRVAKPHKGNEDPESGKTSKSRRTNTGFFFPQIHSGLVSQIKASAVSRDFPLKRKRWSKTKLNPCLGN